MDKQNFTIQGASDKRISIDLTSTNLSVTQPLIIFAHGFKGFKNWGTHHLVADYFAKNGFGFLKFNFSHTGISEPSGEDFDDLESFGANTITKEIFDLKQVISFSQSGEQFPKPSEVFLIGHSMGGAISIIAASEEKSVSKLATWASVSSYTGLWHPDYEKAWLEEGVLYFPNTRTGQQMPIYSSFLIDLKENSSRLDIISAAKKLSQPWLIIHGEQDSSVPPDHALKMYLEHPNQKLLLIPEADHVFGAAHPWLEANLPEPLKLVCDSTINFFKNQL